MKHGLRVAGVLTVGLLWCGGSLAQTGGAKPVAAATQTENAGFVPAPGASLKTDGRLQARVTVTECGISLSALCKQLNENGSVVLACDRDAADQRINLRFRERPLYALLDAVAELLPGTWTPTETGYKLVRQDEARLYRKRWWRLMQNELDGARRDQSDALLKAMRQPAPDLSQFLPEDRAGIALADKYRAALRDLPPAVQVRIAALADSTRVYRRFNDGIAGARDGGVALPLSDVAPALKSIGALTEGPGAAQKLARVRGAIARGTGSEVSVSLVDNQGRDTSLGGASVRSFEELSHITFTDHRFLEGLANQREKWRRLKTPRPWKELIAWHKRTFWKNQPAPPLSSRSGPPLPKGHVDATNYAPFRVPDVWAALGEKHDLDYVTDYYSVAAEPLTPDAKAKLVKQPLADALNSVAAGCDVSWKQAASGVYLSRSNRWYRDDLLEPSREMVSACLAATANPPDPKPVEQPDRTRPASYSVDPAIVRAYLERAAYIAENFDLWQTANGLKYWVDEDALARARAAQDMTALSRVQPFADTVELVLLYPRHLAFYRSLRSEQRDLLMAGGIPLEDLTPAQRDAAAGAAPQLAFVEQPGSKLTIVTERGAGIGGAGVFGSRSGGFLPFRMELRLSE